MDIVRLYLDYSVPHATEGHKHCRPGWVNTVCPFCSGNPGLHLGCNIEQGNFVCWRCGSHPPALTISKLIGVSVREAAILIRKYKGRSRTREPVVKIRRKAHRLPSGTGPMKMNHRRYLERRGFDPERLEAEWGILGTGPVSTLSTGTGTNKHYIDYKHRILVPIHWDNKQVSFQTRSINPRLKAADRKYMACPQDREIIDHKHILYGKQSQWTDTGICVEGVTDVWRLGPGAFATFGIKFTPFQVRAIAQQFRRVFVVFDDDPQAIVQADILRASLKFRGIETIRITIEDDPASMSQSEADYFIKQLLKN